MIRLKRLEKSISILGCALVFAFLLVPRLVVHRHSDLKNDLGAASALESHIERFHPDDRNPVDPSQLHVHWSFSLQPSDTPTQSSSERGLGCCFQTDDSESIATLLFCVPVQHVSRDRFDHDETRNKSIDAPATLIAFKRVLFSVWNI